MEFKKFLRDTLTIKFDKAFGLDIGDRSVEIIELEKVFRFSVVTYGRIELPAGIVENGKIVNQSSLAEKLKRLLKEAKPNRVSTNKAIVSLPESQVFVQCLVVEAKLRSADLNRIILEKIALSLPTSIDKLYWDFIAKPLPDKTKQLIIFIGVPKDVANGYVRFCNSIGLEVVSLCIESLSLARAILKKSDRQSLIMEIGGYSTNLGFFDSNDRINMSISIPVAGNDFTSAVSVGLKIEAPAAEALKMKLGFKDTKDNNLKTFLAPVLDDILTETKKAIEYYEKTFNQKLDDIYVIGGSSLLPGLAEEMKTKLKREVQLVTNGNNINLKFLSEKARDFSVYANVIGLGMLGASGEFRDLNLLRKMPSAEVNSVNKLDLFKLGYLSRVNTVRTILNNKFVLTILVVLIGIIFAILIQQAQNYGYATASSAILGSSF